MNVCYNLYLTQGEFVMTHSTETISYNQYVAFFAAHAREQIQKAITEGGFIYKVKPSEFMLNIDNMSASVYDYYLSYIDPSIRSQYLCNECRHFINRFGCLIVFNANEVREVVGWSMDQSEIPEHFKEAHQKMIELLMKSYIHSPFIVKDKKPVLGSVEKGGFSHLHILVPEVAHEQAVFCNTQNQFKNAGAVHDEFGAFCKKLVAINPESIIRAAGLINHEMVCKSESFKYEVMLLGSLRSVLTNPAGNSDIAERIKKSDAVWKTFIENYGFLNGFKSTAIGGLIDLIEKETPEEDIISQFNAWVAPDKYMRPTAAPADELISRAEEIIETYNLEKSLERRTATLSDLEEFIFWQPVAKPKEEKETKGVFSKLREKEDKKKAAFPTVVKMGYKQFKEEVLPKAKFIEFHAAGVEPYHGLLTAVHPDAEPILKYDKPEKRNTISVLTYHNGNPFYANQYLASDKWNVKPNTMVQVVAILPIVVSPKLEESQADFFVLENCRDTQRRFCLGLFPEFLRAELYPVRSVIEQYSNNTDLTEYREDAVGGLVLFHHGVTMNYKFTVTFDDGMVKTIIIDRSV